MDACCLVVGCRTMAEFYVYVNNMYYLYYLCPKSLRKHFRKLLLTFADPSQSVAWHLKDYFQHNHHVSLPNLK